MMKKIIGLCAICSMLMVTTVFAHPEITVTVDGNQLAFDQPPVIIDDRTLVPMRSIFEALNCEVVWDEASQSITSIHETDVLLMYIGKTDLYRNGVVIYEMPVEAQIINGRTLVPVRAISEALGAEVLWNGETYEVDITSGGSTSETYSSGVYTQNATDANGSVIITGKVTYPSGEMTADEKSAYETQSKTLLADFMSMYSGAATSSSPFSVEYALDLTRCDGVYTSFVVTESATIGSASISDKFGVVYNASGKELDISDVVNDSNSEIEDFLVASFLALAEESPSKFNDDVEDDIEDHLEDVTFYLTDSGIGFLMPAGTIAPESSGTIGFEITYNV
ncbi:stalk domain-containing protein [Chakrabartyella piscis]|uniref:stalk domain-containing protein n=1 Tax=Chakrabartyella piscis TaxID=2918914 RepID=UPI0029588AF4|nr:stalk domain-containing protein [Chakrabartyella piscis]